MISDWESTSGCLAPGGAHVIGLKVYAPRHVCPGAKDGHRGVPAGDEIGETLHAGQLTAGRLLDRMNTWAEGASDLVGMLQESAIDHGIRREGIGAAGQRRHNVNLPFTAASPRLEPGSACDEILGIHEKTHAAAAARRPGCLQGGCSVCVCKRNALRPGKSHALEVQRQAVV